jgi:hypothetical protein
MELATPKFHDNAEDDLGYRRNTCVIMKSGKNYRKAVHRSDRFTTICAGIPF